MCLASYLVHTSQELTFLLNVMVVHRVNGDTRLLGREICAKTAKAQRSPILFILIQRVTWCLLPMFIFPPCIDPMSSSVFVSFNRISSSLLLQHLKCLSFRMWNAYPANRKSGDLVEQVYFKNFFSDKPGRMNTFSILTRVQHNKQ